MFVTLSHYYQYNVRAKWANTIFFYPFTQKNIHKEFMNFLHEFLLYKHRQKHMISYYKDLLKYDNIVKNY